MAPLFGIQKKLGMLSQQPERIEMEKFKHLDAVWFEECQKLMSDHCFCCRLLFIYFILAKIWLDLWN